MADDWGREKRGPSELETAFVVRNKLRSTSRDERETDAFPLRALRMSWSSGGGAVIALTESPAAQEGFDPVAEGNYWKENFRRRPYYEAKREYSHYEPAYRFGWERAALSEYRNRGFDEIEIDLLRGWEYSVAENAGPTWEEAREPVRDAFDRARALEAKRKGGRPNPGSHPKSRSTRQGELL